MREIDLLPQWYKTDRRRQIRYRTEYVGLGLLLAMMGVWNFVASNAVSQVAVQIAEAAPGQAEAKAVSNELAEVRKKLALVQKRAAILDDIDSRIDIAAVLAEISYVVGHNIVLSEVTFKAGGFNAVNGSFSAVRPKGPVFGTKAEPLGKIIFRVTIKGVASEAGDVAALTMRLEDSPYFNHVYPTFSRDRQMIPARAFANLSQQLSCFEIGCDLANYEEIVVKQ